MTTEISEGSKFTLSLKSIIAIIVLVSSFVGQYYVLSNEIELAKRLPESEISRSELDLKLELIKLKNFPSVKILKELPHTSSLYETILVTINDELVKKFLNLLK